VTIRGRYSPVGVKIQRGDLEGGTVQGIMLFWDDTLKEWVPTTISELLWDDTNKTLQPVAMTVKDTSGTIIFHVDDDEMYFTAGIVPIAAGMPMGLLLGLTYAAP
jgi:hypothetical protein